MIAARSRLHRVETRQELAIACDVSVRTVERWIASDDWPFSKTGPWDVAQVKAWRRENRNQRRGISESTPTDPHAAARRDLEFRREVADVAMRELKLAEAQGLLVRRELLDHGERAYIDWIHNRHEELVETLPDDISPEEPGPVRLILRGAFDRIHEDAAEMRFFPVPATPSERRAVNPAKRRAAVKRHQRSKP